VLTRIFDYFAEALRALRDNRTRTLLSILGIMIGIAAVISVSTISKGGSHLIFRELETFGLKSVWVYRHNNNKDPNRKTRPGTGIDEDDLKLLAKCCDAVHSLSPVVRPAKTPIIQNHNRYSNAQIRGVNSHFSLIANDKLQQGRFLQQSDIDQHRAVVVIGPTVAKDLFGASNALNRFIRIDQHKYLVVGLLKKKSRDFLSSIGSSGGQDANNRILLPYTTLLKTNGNEQINFLRIESNSLQVADRSALQIEALLKRIHKGQFDYKHETMASYIKTTNTILRGVEIIGIVAASISLLVGGMGIMNIMGTSVLERTREIGLRKALGARQIDILWQFLIEAAMIALIGGSAGLLLGGLLSVVLAQVTGFPLTPSLFIIVLGFVVSVLTGILSGYLPAKRAAVLHPVDALRHE
jgi:putative ABC transport system permease protein